MSEFYPVDSTEVKPLLPFPDMLTATDESLTELMPAHISEL